MLKNLMLMPYFYMDENEGDSGSSDGNAQIDWSKIDITTIPEDVIKKTTAFTKIKDEAAQRRQENTRLNKQIQSLTEPKNEDEKPEPNVQDKPEDKKPEEIPQWAKEIQDQFKTQREADIANWRTEAATLYGIASAKVAAAIEGNTRAEILANGKKLAEELGLPAPTATTTNTNPNIIVANPVQQRDKGFLEKVKAEMYGQRGNKENPFSANVQRSMGGGVVILDE